MEFEKSYYTYASDIVCNSRKQKDHYQIAQELDLITMVVYNLGGAIPESCSSSLREFHVNLFKAVYKWPKGINLNVINEHMFQEIYDDKYF